MNKSVLIIIVLVVILIIGFVIYNQIKKEKDATNNLKTAIADKQSKDVNAIQTAILSAIPLV